MATVNDLQKATPGSVAIIDVRKKPDESQIPGSVRYDGEALEQAAVLPFRKQEHVVLYCGSGNSCSRIAEKLRARGYTNAEALEGGYTAWKEAGMPLEPIAQQRDLGGA
jgi:rhodanese-related sulfurtransferase